ncbi:MAG: RagB/SusD family nutrient uptake outer membrane protein [Prevotella sp.]|jgi:hypothetical protein|nr:RagB/SusD family nutrient uptake outer membrane protein [Prevotella sp.]
MKKIKYYIAIILFIGTYTGCVDLDIPPKNIVQDGEIFANPSGVQTYMAALYSRMPIEDFKYSANDGGGTKDGFNTWNCINNPMLNTGENANRNNGGWVNPAKEYWYNGYLVIRNSNYLIAEIQNYESVLGKANTDKWAAEAKFIRAYTYFALVKRYGGVPIIEGVQDLEAGIDALKIPRSSEKDVYDYILEDLDDAINGLSEKSEHVGRANKYVAAAYKSRFALFAGSIARYGVNQIYERDGIMLCGIPASEANKYFEMSYKAAKLLENAYSLYSKKWSATDKKSTSDNYADLFIDSSSPENIFSKGYSYTDAVHSFDAVYSPPHLTGDYGDRFNPTLDYVELFDGLPINDKGQLKTTNDDGTYIVYNSIEELFENCEPRLRGTVLLPGQPFKGGYVDLRRGLLIESVDPATPIQKFVEEGLTSSYQSNTFYKENMKEAGDHKNQTQYVLSNGTKLNPVGLDGPNSANSATVTGFHGRKWLDPNMAPAETKLHVSTMPWVDMRYAEVLLNRAEAALELYQNGQTTIDGTDLRNDAYECINKIRNRAGATLLSSSAELSNGASIGVEMGVGGYVLAPNRGLQIIRIERRKELAFENKLWWDMRRWRTVSDEVNNRRWRKLNPFLFSKTAVVKAIDYYEGKYIFDCRYDERGSRFTVEAKYVYEAIPGGQINANPLLIQNQGY